MDVAALLKEIADGKAFFAAREGKDNAALLKSFATTMGKKLREVATLSVEDATNLEEALGDKPYGEHTKIVSDALESNVKHVLDQPTKRAKTVRKQKQLLTTWQNYFCENHWESLKNKTKTFESKLTLVCEVAFLLGLVDPEQECFKWMLAIVMLCHYDVAPNNVQIHDKLVELKGIYETEKKDFGLLKIVKFPDHPSDLPDDILNHCYGETMPISMDVPGLQLLLL